MAFDHRQVLPPGADVLAILLRHDPRDLGQVMGWLSPRTRGRADGRAVSGLVAAALARADLAAHDDEAS